MTVLDVQRIERALRGPLPGVNAQLVMAPVYRRDPSMASVEDKPCQEAAVLLLLHRADGEWSILFIERPDHLARHAGQIAFPGGRREADETHWETALRETREEVGVPENATLRLGPLTPLFVPPSGYCVYPFVGLVSVLPPLRTDPAEVADAFSVPLQVFAGAGCRTSIRRTVRGHQFDVPCFEVGARHIWGATAMILSEFMAVLRVAGTD